MTYLLERPRNRRPFASADVLSEYGETVCMPELHLSIPQRGLAKPQAVVAATVGVRAEAERLEEQDPERWDGLS